MSRNPEQFTAVSACVERLVTHCAGELRVAAPLGLGKPNVLLNALYARVAADAKLRLDIYTALSLAVPKPKNDLERRFLVPFAQRQFGADYPDLAYVAAQKDGTLPANVLVQEFYLQSGALLGVESAQRHYASMNYTHVARDLVDRRINLVVQLIAAREEAGRTRYSLACNPDVTADLLDRMRDAGLQRPYVIGVVHPDLPYIGNEAEAPAEFFDGLLCDPACDHRLFALPRDPVDAVEYAIGLHASALVRDGGTLQIGIGALSDALVHALLLRRRNGDAYRSVLAAIGSDAAGKNSLAERIGGLDPLPRGLYGASEMVMDGFMHLARAGILSRRIYDDIAIERALAAGIIGETLPAHAADALHEAGALPDRVDASVVGRLATFGMLPADAQFVGSTVRLADDSALCIDPTDASVRQQWNAALAGRRLRGGRYLRGAFYLGSSEFYDWLRGLRGDDFDGLSMTRVSDINQLYGGREQLDALQRRGARFFNTCMMASVLGAATSDALENGQVVSGVGGQYNFVAMAHALADGRSVLMLRATRMHKGRLESNIVWNYGYTTIPRHLRDVYVTEYGTADLRGKSDEDCIIAMLAIADAQFQDELAARAKAAGKLRHDFEIPSRWKENTQGKLSLVLSSSSRSALFPQFPFGSDFSDVERELLPALGRLRAASATRLGLAKVLLRSLTTRLQTDDETGALLARLDLKQPRTLQERITRRVVLAALR